MANKNPANKFSKGNKAATVNKGKPKRTTSIKRILEFAVIVDRKYPNLQDLASLFKAGMYEAATHPKKEVRIKAAKDFSELFFPKKKIVDVGDGLSKILEVQRPIGMIINTQPGLFDPEAPDKKTQKDIKDVRKKISELAKQLREKKSKQEN